MTEEKKGRRLFALKRVVMRCPCTSLGEFVERYRGQVEGDKFYLPKPDLFPAGTMIQLELHLSDGRPAMKGRAVVEEKTGERTGTPVRFTALDPVSRGVLRQLMEQAGEPPAAGATSNRQMIERVLEGMTLVRENFGEPKSVTAGERSPKGMVLGIDLGTTNCCCSVVKEGKPFVIPSRLGHMTIPSVVAVDSQGQVVVGHAARAQMEINPARTIYGSKRLVGRPFASPIVQEVRDRFHYQIVAGPDGRAAVQIEDKVFSLEKISGLILEEIRSVAQEYLGKVIMRAVITVPAYYNENQREAVRAAGALAGLHVERILNEPTSAALAYGLGREKNQRLLVFDLGGGTFDATVMKVSGNCFEVLATGGDTFLGGVDFDTQLMDHIIIEFQLQLGRLPQFERVALLRALQGAEFAKCALCSRQEAEVHLPYIGQLDGKPVDLKVKVTREKLEELARPLVERTLSVCDEVLRRAGLGREQLDAILLVGGQTRMPLIWRLIEEHFGKAPLKGVHPDESVAIGAALLADSLERVQTVMLLDVLPMTIGAGIPGGRFVPLIEAGTRVPVDRTFALRTFLDQQEEMLLPIYQGESRQVDENEYLGTVHVRGINPGALGSRTIELTLKLSPECLLTVSAADSQGSELGEVIMTTRDTPASLSSKLGLDGIPATELEGDRAKAAPAPPRQPGPDEELPPVTETGDFEEEELIEAACQRPGAAPPDAPVPAR